MFTDISLWRVARVFFDEPTKKHGLREISRKAKLSPPSVKHHLNTLENNDIIRIENKQQHTQTYPLYMANYENDNYRFYKKQDMLFHIHESELVKHLYDIFQPDCIILFGSAMHGTDIETSDIDIFMQGPEKEIDLVKFERILKRKIQLHTKEDFRKYPEELRSNIANGVNLAGFLNAS